MTFYLESKQQVSRLLKRNQEMECHTTPHLTRKFQLSRQMEVAIIFVARIAFLGDAFLGEGTLNECMSRGYFLTFDAFTT